MDNTGGKLNGLDWVANPDEVRQKIIDAASALYVKKASQPPPFRRSPKKLVWPVR